MLPHSMARLFTVWLLLLATVDLFVPSLGQAEEPLFHAVEATQPAHESDDAPESPDHCPDDCFCCCAHIDPTPSIRCMGGLVETPERSVTQQPEIVDRPGSDLFRPPRR